MTRVPPFDDLSSPLISWLYLKMCFHYGQQRYAPSHDKPTYLPPMPWPLAQATPASAPHPRSTC